MRSRDYYFSGLTPALFGDMTVGVILDSEVDVAASFYIPTETLALDRLSRGLALASSHILLEIDSKPQFAVQVQTKVRRWSRLAGNLLLILPLADVDVKLDLDNVSLVMLVPVVDSIGYWSKLRHWGRNHRLILDLSSPVPEGMLQRYKCLPYDAVVATCTTLALAQHLIAKRPMAHLLARQASISHILEFVSMSRPSLLPHSDELIDPLQPLTDNLGLEVYQTFEQDKVKYSQYDGAIEMAIEDLRSRKAYLSILVIGPGRGPLLDMTMKYTSDEDTVVAIERNPNCIDILQNISLTRSLVTVIQGDVRNLPERKYDLIVSELLGSFGCNEACPEILQHFTSSQTIMIPLSYNSYLQPAYCDVLEVYHAKRPYVANLNGLIALGQPIPIFHFSHPGKNELDQTVSLDLDASPTDPCNVLMGYFDAHLYGPFRIGITPQMSNHERCSSWYPMVFPVGLLEMPFTVSFSRKSTESQLWYQWKVNDTWFNHYAAQYAVKL